MINFNEMGIREEILKALEELNFETPMPIQEKVIPFLLDNDGDLVALAQTGTGKTAGFGIPIIQQTDIQKKHIQHLVLCPTRELCLQIADDLYSYSKYIDKFKVGAVFGGSSIDKQIKMLKKGVHVVSATPGRLLDMIKRKKVDLSKVETVVLDEADEMLNMGFREDLEAILEKTPASKNTLLFSATMPKDVLAIANSYMKNYEEITVGKRNAGAENVSHVCYKVHAKDRYLALKRIVDYNPDLYGIVFCRTRRETQEVADKLMHDGYNADALHGDLSQPQRDVVMNKFRNKHITLLAATDVAARGIDVDNISHIINYNLPDETEIYTHRSGRTGRAGKKGTSIAIINLKEKRKISDIERLIKKKFSFQEVPRGEAICEKQLLHLIDRMEKVEVNDKKIEKYLPEITKKLEWLDREELIKKFVSLEFNRFLEYYRRSSDLNTPQESKKFKDKKEKKSRKSDPIRKSQSGYTRFFLNLGRKDDITPVSVIGMIKDYSKVKNIDIGDIEILKNFTFFETESEFDKDVMKGFNKQNHKKRKVVLEVASGNSNKKNKRKRRR